MKLRRLWLLEALVERDEAVTTMLQIMACVLMSIEVRRSSGVCHSIVVTCCVSDCECLVIRGSRLPPAEQPPGAGDSSEGGCMTSDHGCGWMRQAVSVIWSLFRLDRLPEPSLHTRYLMYVTSKPWKLQVRALNRHPLEF